MTSPANDSVIISRYGNRVIKWDDASSLRHTLNQLRGERETIGRQPYLRITDTDSQRLLSEAEWAKDNTNQILEAETRQ